MPEAKDVKSASLRLCQCVGTVLVTSSGVAVSSTICVAVSVSLTCSCEMVCTCKAVEWSVNVPTHSPPVGQGIEGCLPGAPRNASQDSVMLCVCTCVRMYVCLIRTAEKDY